MVMKPKPSELSRQLVGEAGPPPAPAPPGAPGAPGDPGGSTWESDSGFAIVSIQVTAANEAEAREKIRAKVFELQEFLRNSPDGTSVEVELDDFMEEIVQTEP